MTKLNAWLRPNPLTEDKSDYVAVPQTQGSLNNADIVKELQKEGMEIRPETAVDIITRYNRKVAEKVLQGNNVNTGLVYMRPVIRGVFYDRTWNPQKHSVYVAMNQGNDLRKAVAETTVTILGEQSEPIAIFGITDNTTGKTDGTLINHFAVLSNGHTSHELLMLLQSIHEFVHFFLIKILAECH